MPFPHEEDREVGAFRGWLIIVLVCVVIVAWGLLNYLLIPDVPRRWDIGALRDVPASSVYSTREPAAGAAVPRQLAPPPDATPARGGVAP